MMKMGESVVSKKVSFVGVWRAATVSDQLLRQIYSNLPSKRHYPANIRLSPSGMELIIFGSNGVATRKDQIPLENIVDFVDNKFSTTCLLAIVREKQQQMYNVFVFLCSYDRDAAEMIKTFKVHKRQLSGEGYNVDVTSKGQNWTLITKEQTEEQIPVTVPQPNGKAVRVNGTEGNVIHVGIGGREYIEQDHQTKAEMRGELYHIAGEIRDIKRMLSNNPDHQVYPNDNQYPQIVDDQTVYITERRESPELTFAEKRQNRESKGRHHFENHYGYRILQQPGAQMQTINNILRQPGHREVRESVVSSRQVVEPRQVELRHVEPRQVEIRQVEPRRQTVYVKKSKQSTKKHFVSVSPSKQATVKSRTFYTTQSVPPSPGSNLSYTKRVYDSANPYMYATQRVHGHQPLTLVATNKKHRFRQRSPLRKTISLGTDIVPRNIENVYRHRTFKRIIVPPPQPSVSPSVLEYVNVQSNGAASTINNSRMYEQMEHVDYVDNGNDEDQTVHVAYPPVRGVYESREDIMMQNASFANVSTAANVSTDDGLDDNVIMNGEAENDYSEVSRDVRRDGDVIVIKTGADQAHTSSSRRSSDSIHIETTVVDRHEEPKVIGGEVYHVKAVSVEDYEQQKEYGDNVTVITAGTPAFSHSSHRSSPVQQEFGENVTVITAGTSHYSHSSPSRSPIMERAYINTEYVAENHDRDRVITVEHTDITRSENTDGGLFGAYTTRPEYDDTTAITAESSTRYHDDVDEVGESVAKIEIASDRSSDIHSVKSDLEDEGARVKHVHYSTEDVHIIDQYPDNKADDSNPEDDRESLPDHQTNAYTYEHHETDGVNTVYDRDDHDDNDGNKDDEEEEEEYVMDMDALKRSMEEPELEIVKPEPAESYNSESPSTSRINGDYHAHNGDSDSDTEHDKYNDLGNNVVHETTEHFEETTVSNGVSKTAAEKDAFARQFLDENAIRLITNRTENSVLF